MERILECLMLICFGLSWPISVYKSYTSRSTKGKSVYFTVAILLGYLCGIAAKIIGGDITDTSAKGVIQGFKMPAAPQESTPPATTLPSEPSLPADTSAPTE